MINRTILILIILILKTSCTKEKKLYKSGFPENGEIFISGYLNNIGDNQISIFGKNLIDLGIDVFIDTGFGFEKLSLVYDQSQYKYDINLRNFSFKPSKTYKFKITSTKYNDSCEFIETIPENINPQVEITYPSLTEYFATLKFGQLIDNSKIYAHDINYSGSLGDTLSQNVPLFGNIYLSRELPNILELDGRIPSFEEVEKLNKLNAFNGIRIPHYSMFMGKCRYISVSQKIKFTISRFFKDDFEYIKSISENIINSGNPFFLNYQLKNIVKSKKQKIYGIIVSSNISRNNNVVVSDNSDTSIKVFIKDNGINIIGNPNYRISILESKNIDFSILYNGDKCWYLSSCIVEYLYNSCDKKYFRDNEISIQFSVYDKINKKLKNSNKINFKINQSPIILNFEI